MFDRMPKIVEVTHMT